MITDKLYVPKYRIPKDVVSESGYYSKVEHDGLPPVTNGMECKPLNNDVSLLAIFIFGVIFGFCICLLVINP